MADDLQVAVHDDDVPGEYELVTGEAVALDVRPASVILRAAGTIIDWFAYIGLYLLMVLIVGWLFAESIDESFAQALSVAGLVIAILVVPTLVETASGGRSLGKLAVGARIVRDDGGAIALRHSFIRALVGVIEIYMTFGGIAAVTGLLNSKSKRLGDLLAGTYSQHERVPQISTVVHSVPLELTSWSQTADVAKLPDALSRRISQFLDQSAKLAPNSRARIAHELATEATPFVSPVPNVHPELFLAGVHAIRREREYAALMLEQNQLTRLRPVLTGQPHDFPTR